MASLKVLKKELRLRIKQVLGELSLESVSSQTSGAVKSLLSLPEYQAAQRISIYLSMPSGEISTAEIVNDALKHGKKVFVPYTYKLTEPQNGQPSSIMDMLELQSTSDYQSLQPDKWGIPTLSGQSVSSRANSMGGKGLSQGKLDFGAGAEGLDFIVMPGMAFDTQFRRLGHGKGFYDYFLDRCHRQSKERPAVKMPFLAGLALKEQLLDPLEYVPVDETDWPLDALVVGDGQLLRSKGN